MDTGDLERASRGIDGVRGQLAGPAPAVEAEREAWLSHAEFEERWPDFLEDARRAEVDLAARYAEKHGSLDGYVASREFPCPGTLRVFDESGRIWALECDGGCGFEVSVPMEVAAPGRLAGRRLERAGLPEGFLERKFEVEPYHEQLMNTLRWWVRDFQKQRIPAPGLIGEPGRGKTHLLSVISRDLITRYGTDLIYRSAVTLFDELQAALGTDSFEIKWERLCTVPVLVLDDLGQERATEWRNERLAQLIDRRYSESQRAEVEHHRPILIATNIAPNVWPEVFGERPASRLRGMVRKLRVEGPDRRAGMGVQERLVA